MATIWVYPGQGAQKVNMLHELPQTKRIKQYLEQATDALQQDVFELDQAEALENTRAVQLCLLISGVCSSDLLLQQGVQPDFVAGLSIGAWSAAVVSGVLRYEDALKLVALRGTLMQDAFPKGYGMYALLGADQQLVESWVDQVYQQTKSVFIANINAHNQIVISGAIDAMQRVAQIAKAQGAVIKPLNVSIPSHCELLSSQAKQLYKEMEGITFKQPQISYLSGTSARRIIQSDLIKEDLAFNMCRTIDWESTVEASWERGNRLQIEMLPGTVLTGLAKRVFKNGKVLSFQGTRIDSLVDAMNEESQSVY